MAALLGLLAALAYGTSDFAAGLSSRRLPVGQVTVLGQSFGLLLAVVAVLVVPGTGLTAPVFWWGALAGVGSGIGTLALYKGLSVARMSEVATCSGVLTAVLPAAVGLLLGNRLSTPALIGIGVAVMAIGLVSWQPRGATVGGARAGLAYGALAGVGFALLFIALDEAGIHAGAWPLVPSEVVSILVALPFTLRMPRPSRALTAPAAAAVGAGILGGTSNLLFLAASGRGQLAIVAVLTALYPGVTILLARVFLSERWSRVQVVGLVAAAAAIAMISVP